MNAAIDWVINMAVKGVKAAGKFIGGLFGGKNKDAGKEDKQDPAGKLRGQVGQALASQLTQDHTREEAIEIVTKIEREFKPLGLKSLEVGQELDVGASPILAEASPKRPRPS